MHTTLERIEKYNRQKNKLKLRRLEKVSNELLSVIAEKNDIIDDQAEEIEKLKEIVQNYQKQLVVKNTTVSPSNNKDEYMSITTCKYGLFMILLLIVKNILVS